MRVDLQGGSVEFKARESVLSKIEASLQPGFEPVQPKYAATVMLVRDSAPFQTEYRIESDHFPPRFPNRPGAGSVYASSRKDDGIRSRCRCFPWW